MLSFKKWLEATGAARIHPDPLIDPGIAIRMRGTGKGGVPDYPGEEIIKKLKDPEKMFGIKKIERQSKK